jgi:hypothetical protein
MHRVVEIGIGEAEVVQAQSRGDANRAAESCG